MQGKYFIFTAFYTSMIKITARCVMTDGYMNQNEIVITFLDRKRYGVL